MNSNSYSPHCLPLLPDKAVFPRIRLEALAELLTVIPDCPEGFMKIHAVIRHIDDAPGDIGAVVRGPFQTGKQIRPYEACIHGAQSLLEPENMAGAHLLLELVDHLL